MNRPNPRALDALRLVRGPLEIGVTPAYGANLISLRYQGRELIHFDRNACLAGEKITGAFHMFPTPCRLQGGAYSFEGRRIEQNKKGESITIHGLVRDEPFEVLEMCPDLLRVQLAFNPGTAVFEGFPFPCLFELQFAVEERSVTIRYRVRNTGPTALPFGYGIHPYWIICGPRQMTQIRIPCDRVLESRDLIPTGGTRSIAGTSLDFRTLRPLGDQTPDHVFWKRHRDATAELYPSGQNVRILISASPDFTHMILYAPSDSPFLCLENLTSAPNAQNLPQAGDVAHLLVLPPNQSAEGWVRYEIRPL